ncbi:hypothetical protein [Sphingobium boeckii]|uniref:Uncharacterized protein n=1 Tax=Sphingobium boeckii TaxID=1082345 RepID=A0A7W9AEG1_9SPHN|nr:hypothetical protein [Sphingobium boeckii]MBB5684190.1 hypothetical protein [Sphingobium boeckii]
MTPQEEQIVRKRQKSRALIVALMLGAFVLLIYGISIAKIAAGS